MSDIWYRLSNGQTEGPYSLLDLQRLADNGQLKPTDSLSQEGGTWRPAAEFPDIRFAAPVTHSLNYPAPSQEPVMVTPRVFDLLRQTSVWVRIMSIITFVASGFMLLAGVIMIALGAFAATHGGSASAAPALLGVVYIPMAFLYIVPAIYLFRYASHAKAFVRLRTEQELEEAIQAQKSFWKFCAILALIIIGAYLLFIPIMVIGFILAHR